MRSPTLPAGPIRPPRERFQREARAVAGLQHPNICTLHDVGETVDGHAFIVMELLQGETLEQRFPDDTNAKFTYVPTLRAVVALKRHDLPRALDLLRMNEPYELAIAALPYNNFFGALYPVYLRGEVYRAQGNVPLLAQAKAVYAKLR